VLTLRSPKIAVIDYGAGNIQSVLNAMRRIGLENTFLTNSVSDIRLSDAYILPGVGAFGHCMRNLTNTGLIPALEREILTKKKPILGICIGMQLLAESSEEAGLHSGLGWIPGHVKRIQVGSNERIPHVGWNRVKIIPSDRLFLNIKDKSFFYFDHSYAYSGDQAYVSGTTSHGFEITASIEHENIHGVQFHPEKSDRNGLRIFRAFENMISLC